MGVNDNDEDTPMAKRPVSPEEMLGLALISLATPLAGKMLGGNDGAMIGAQAGLGGAGKYLGARADDAKEQDKFDRALAQKQAEREEKFDDAVELEKVKADLKPAGTTKNALGQVIDKGTGDIIDENKTPPKPVKTGGGAKIPKPPPTRSFGGAQKQWDGEKWVDPVVEGDVPPPKGGAAKGSTSGDATKLVGVLKGSSRDAIGQSKSKIAVADSLQVLLDKFPDGNLPPQYMRETAIALATMLSPGVPPLATVEHLTADTWEGRAKELLQKISGKPVGAGQEEFVKMTRDTVAREREAAEARLNQETARILPGYKALRDSDPATFNSILRNNGLHPKEFDADMTYKPIGKQSKKALNWAEAEMKKPEDKRDKHLPDVIAKLKREGLWDE